MIDLTGKAALVTGGARGIGRAIVLRLATKGADVAFSYRGNADAAAETAKAVEALGRRALAIQADVKDPEAADALVKAALDAFGKVDILVNNAGITRDDLIMRMSEADWRDVLETNLFGAFHMTKAVTRPMLAPTTSRETPRRTSVPISMTSDAASDISPQPRPAPMRNAPASATPKSSASHTHDRLSTSAPIARQAIRLSMPSSRKFISTPHSGSAKANNALP